MNTQNTDDPRAVLAFDVGGTTLKAALVDAERRVLETLSLPSRRGPEILDVLVEAASELGGRTHVRPAAAGVILPGIVDAASGRCVRAVNLGIVDLPVVDELSARIGMPVGLGHDVATAAQAVVEAAPHALDPLVVVLGTGLAVTTYVGGRPVAGTSGQAGELGHVVVVPNGRECQCGNRGCLETMIGGRGLLSAYAEATGERLDGVRELLARRSSDPVAERVWDQGVGALADGLLGACALLAPGAILLAGGLSGAGADLTELLAREMAARTRVVTVPPIEVSVLGARAGMFGAAGLAWSTLASGPMTGEGE